MLQNILNRYTKKTPQELNTAALTESGLAAIPTCKVYHCSPISANPFCSPAARKVMGCSESRWHKPIVSPNPGYDPPPVNLARDAREGLYQQLSCWTGKPSTVYITGKGRFYGKNS